MKKITSCLIICSLLILGCNKDKKEPIEIVYGTGVDNNGKTFTSVKIGEQWWMAENLASDRFQNGDSLNYVSLENATTTWNAQTQSAFTFHNDSLFGYLYNFKTIEDARNIAPKGWRVPTDEDWKQLEKYIGMHTEAANAFGWRGVEEANLLTTKYSKGWPEFSPLYGKDSYGFNAKPGGCITLLNTMNSGANTAFWWTSSNENNEGYYRYIDYQQTRILRSTTSKLYGMSIRCIKE
jgi:uncharacterized protein (TIGR02145 family)